MRKSVAQVTVVAGLVAAATFAAWHRLSTAPQRTASNDSSAAARIISQPGSSSEGSVPANVAIEFLQSQINYLRQRQDTDFEIGDYARRERAMTLNGVTEPSERAELLRGQFLQSYDGSAAYIARDFYPRNIRPLFESIMMIEKTRSDVPVKDLNEIRRQMAALKAYESVVWELIARDYALLGQMAAISSQQAKLSDDDRYMSEIQLSGGSINNEELVHARQENHRLGSEFMKLLAARQALKNTYKGITFTSVLGHAANFPSESAVNGNPGPPIDPD